ncbi:MAG: c-type cytochrome biogenesis protein CcmI [Gammaproteobacteria bacterium]|nr:c-type cytochrome biogenesis protein CcmI [Gammaproteobacteria bacterium]
MISFWVCAGVITLVTMLVLVIPVLRSHNTSSAETDRSDLNIGLIKDRLSELELEFQQQRIDKEHYSRLKDELQLALAKDLETTDQTSTNHRPADQGKLSAVIIVLLVPFITIGLYLYFGEVSVLGEPAVSSANTRPVNGSAQQPPASVESMVAGLARRLQDNPDDAQGWSMLGRSYMVMGRYQEASDAYEQLHRLTGDNPSVLLQHAQAIVLVNNGSWNKESIAKLKKALQLEPQNTVALSLSGLLAARQGNSQLAVKQWRKAQQTLQPNTPEFKQLETMIASIPGNAVSETDSIQSTARNTASDPVLPSQAQNSDRSIQVKVNISPELMSKTSADQTIFIFAQALSGPPMPIAVVRKAVSELPVVVTLDDTMAMMPTRKLSSFEQVRIAARISQSGSAMPAAGDLEGKVEPVNLATTRSVSVTINRVL